MSKFFSMLVWAVQQRQKLKLKLIITELDILEILKHLRLGTTHALLLSVHLLHYCNTDKLKKWATIFLY